MSTKANLVIDQGSDFQTELSLLDDNGDPIDLNGYYANSQIRKWYTSLKPAAVFNAAINVESGTIILTLSANQTSRLVAGRYVYDVETTSPGMLVSRVVEGIVTVTPQVTR